MESSSTVNYAQQILLIITVMYVRAHSVKDVLPNGSVEITHVPIADTRDLRCMICKTRRQQNP
jgi:hypothetical protein